MSELAFFRAFEPVVLEELARECGAALPPGAAACVLVRGVALPSRADRDELTAFHDGVPLDDLRATRAAACLVAPRHCDLVPSATVPLVTDHPAEAFKRLAARLGAGAAGAGSAYANRGIDPAARIHAGALIERGVVIDAGAIIGPDVEVGTGTFIGAYAVIGAGVRIGRNCAIDAQVTIRHALVGDRVSISAGARIGHGAGSVTLGRVIIQDDVAIGVNASVERGSLGDTVIGESARIAAFGAVNGGATVARRMQVAAR